ncbi:MAG: outer membrane protein assembly factor BamE [Sulfuritalea sp.]|nr:outer membrane protein assembly factor BamE [Sulfuritalea sp.]MBS3916366.1 outer membrane protein assembly factor BamE [Sulfuritalea sp.]
MRFLRYLPVLLPLAACSNVQMPDVASAITPYRIDIRQGNYITQDMVAQLKPGMTRDQVRFILGTPLVADIFHADRWDYIYSFKPGRGTAQLRRFAVFFVDHKLARVAGDVVGAEPGDAESAATAAAGARSRVIEIVPAAGAKKEEDKDGDKKPESMPDSVAQPAEKK